MDEARTLFGLPVVEDPDMPPATGIIIQPLQLSEAEREALSDMEYIRRLAEEQRLLVFRVPAEVLAQEPSNYRSDFD